MNKKTLIPIIAMVLGIVIVPSALAQENVLSPLTDALDTFVSFVFVDVSEALGAILFIKLLIWLVLFTVFYAILMGVKTLGKKKYALPVAFSIALISVIFMPDPFVLSIAFSYSVVVSFLLMAIPVVALLYLIYKTKLFPTGPSENVSTRRVNHGIKAVVFYFLATLVTNYMSVVEVAIGDNRIPLDVAVFSNNWVEMGNLVVAAAMILFLYHIIMAIFAGGGKETPTGEEGILGQLLKPSEGKKEPEIPSESAGEEGKGPDLSPIVGKIGELREKVDNYETAARRILNQAETVRMSPDEKIEENRNEFLKNLRSMRGAGADVDSTANAVADQTELFRNLKDQHIVQLIDIVRTYRRANEELINAINLATQ